MARKKKAVVAVGGGDLNVTDRKHWHYFLQMEIALPNKINLAKAEDLLDRRIIAYVENTLHGSAESYSSKRETCSGRRLSGNCEQTKRLGSGRSKARSSRRQVNLYWVTTPDHDEDWFILARSPESAAEFHTSYEGYDSERAEAELILPSVVGVVLDQPEPHNKVYWTSYPRHAQLEDLQKFGFAIVNDGKVSSRRIVRLAGRTFQEGDLEVAVAAARRKMSGVDKDDGTIN
jgi:hypothetical protein